MRCLFALVCVLVACASSSSSSSGTDAAVATPKLPTHHRPTATDCPTARDPGNAMASNPGACKSDADCTKGSSGRCNFSLGSGGNTCSYDLCTTDGQCGAGVCLCRDPSSAGANVCVNGACRLDAQCAPYACSPSGVNLDVGCRGNLQTGQLGYFCHGAGDECVDDADCNGSSQSCVFSVDKLRWVCVSTPCAG